MSAAAHSDAISESGRRKGRALNFASAWAFYVATVWLHLGTGITNGDANLPASFYAFTRYALGFAVFGTAFACSAYLARRAENDSRSNDASDPGRSGRLHARRFLIARGLFNLMALLCFYQSVAAGATGTANVLNMTYPAFVAMLAGPLLGERPDRRTLQLVTLAVSGVLLLIFVVPEQNLAGGAAGLSLPGGFALRQPGAADLWGIASGLAAGFAIVSLRGAARVAGPIEILCWMFGIGTLALLPVHLGDAWQLMVAPGDLPREVWFVLGSASCGILGQWTLSISYRYLDAPTGSVISASRIPIALFMGALFLGETLGLAAWLGAGLILLSNLLLARQKTKGATKGR